MKLIRKATKAEAADDFLILWESNDDPTKYVEMDWIPVAVHLPKKGATVLIYDPASGRHVAKYNGSGGEWSAWFTSTGGSKSFEHVTHWLPLPGSPQKDEK